MGLPAGPVIHLVGDWLSMIQDPTIVDLDRSRLELFQKLACELTAGVEDDVVLEI